MNWDLRRTLNLGSLDRPTGSKIILLSFLNLNNNGLAVLGVAQSNKTRTDEEATILSLRPPSLCEWSGMIVLQC